MRAGTELSVALWNNLSCVSNDPISSSDLSKGCEFIYERISLI